MPICLRKTPYGRSMGIMVDFRQVASHTAPHHSQVITDLTTCQIFDSCLTTGIVMDLVCPLEQLLCVRHAVVWTIVPMGVKGALSTESDGKRDRIQSQLLSTESSVLRRANFFRHFRAHALWPPRQVRGMVTSHQTTVAMVTSQHRSIESDGTLGLRIFLVVTQLHRRQQKGAFGCSVSQVRISKQQGCIPREVRTLSTESKCQGALELSMQPA